MVGISKLYCGTVEASDPLRYRRQAKALPSHLLQFSVDKKPVVVWNVTRRCNLNCRHCYSHSANVDYSGELTTQEGLVLLDDLAAYGVPVVLFSGGEPLMRPDILELIAATTARGMRAVVSTNGTLLTPATAERLREAGLSYAGVSLDGLAETNDKFRGANGAFDKAMAGIRACREAGVKVGLRFTLTRENVADLSGVFDLIGREEIPRVCFYHLVYTGRATNLTVAGRLSHDETRRVVDLIMERTRALHEAGKPLEVLTVDNHADGPYVYLRLLREDPVRAAAVLELLQMNGGNGSGRAIGCVSWDGTVHPDQFWRHEALGNVRQRPFSTIWSDPEVTLLSELRNRKTLLHGRCATCRWLNICNGNFRVRAEAVTGDLWAPDPDCYLTDEEISI
ncbi:MAG: 12,18-didecarboxysiroheme deacetylase [Lentisphaerae bacterium]|jgi:12,18-didecarboxysiroheme deacetylase|nr:12,18-didecarboxysiroheme deacetylase [Lentisphaerota bacterium]